MVIKKLFDSKKKRLKSFVSYIWHYVYLSPWPIVYLYFSISFLFVYSEFLIFALYVLLSLLLHVFISFPFCNTDLISGLCKLFQYIGIFLLFFNFLISFVHYWFEWVKISFKSSSVTTWLSACIKSILSLSYLQRFLVNYVSSILLLSFLYKFRIKGV